MTTASRKRVEEAFEEHMKRIAILRSVPSKEGLFTAGYLACAREALRFLHEHTGPLCDGEDLEGRLAEHLGIEETKS